MKLSVIIVSYNVKYYLCQCLDSLRRAIESIDAEIYVIDNHSKDGTVELIKKEYKEVKVIASNHNNGFAKANNIAIRQTNSEYVLLLNPDTFVGENTIKNCLDFMDNHDKAGGLGVCMLKRDGSKAMESRRGLPTPMTAFYKMCGLCSRYPSSRRFGKYYMGYLPWDTPGEIEIVSGAFFMMKRVALNKAGLLDEDFFMYGEDIDLSYRLLKCNYENWYFPTKILHYKGESTHTSSFRYVHVFYEAMLIFFKKHFGHLSIWLNFPIKTAIYLKATLALINMSYQQIRKALGFSQYTRCKTPQYIFIGSKDALDKCKTIADGNGLMARYVQNKEMPIETIHAELIKETDKKDQVYFVYDMGSFKYETVLDIFAKYSVNNVFVGTYNPKNNIIITDKEILN